ncbi:MAG: NUDIX domain-containing protein [Propionivibrio sp.]|uniref:NUDIX domain-containing protein n=1 Tax=Propionivibrio sp. TaxID=2212460 RepID=UPI00345D6341|nr:NUDIX domain-containing protein [Propionivibrio sp.]
MSEVVEVAAAILLREGQEGTEFLLAQRPEGKPYSGYWEFPGGKVEPGESLREALQRELQEELGITLERAWPWLSCQYTYPHATVRLKFFRVVAWQGEIAPIEHSGFAWTRIGAVSPVAPLLPANGPILRALDLPSLYAPDQRRRKWHRRRIGKTGKRTGRGPAHDPGSRQDLVTFRTFASGQRRNGADRWLSWRSRPG